MDKEDIDDISSGGSDTEDDNDDVSIVLKEEDFDIEELDDDKEAVDDDKEELDDDKEELDDDKEELDDDFSDNDDENGNIHNTIVGGDDFSDDEDEDDDYLQKMDKKMKQNIVDSYHHDLKIHNADEIDVACTVARNDDGYIVDSLHKTLPFVTTYEKSRILGERAKQIEAGAHPFIELDETIIDSYLIALKEYEAKKIPFIIQRPLPNGMSEYWRLSDLELLE